MSGWEEAEGEGRGGGRDDEGENEMRMERRDATIGGGGHSTCLPNRCRAEEEGVTRPRLLEQQFKMLGYNIHVWAKKDRVKLSAVFE